MAEQKVMNRWLAVVGAVLIQLALGAIYAWSVFTPSLIDAGWSKAQTQFVFSAGLAFFAIVMVWAGRQMPKWGPKKLAMISGVVLGLGYVLGGLAARGDTPSPALLILCVGVIGGSGIGLGYVVPIAVGMKWFPDKKGLITGLAVAGFGFGAMLWVKLAGAWGNLIATIGLGNTFIIYGILFFAMVCIGGLWMVNPPEGWRPEGWTPPPPKQGQVADGVNFEAGEMLRTPQFYMIFVTFVFSAGAGLMTIGLMKLFPKEALQLSGKSAAEASAIAGTAMAVFFSLANGIGRIAWGTMSDKLGRKASVAIMCATQGVFMLLFVKMAGSVGMLYLAAVLIGFNFGGNFSLFPTFTADTYGAKNVGQLYPWVFLAYGVGGIFGPVLGGRLGDLGNFPLAFTICGILCLVAAAIAAAVKPPKKAAA
ncbi:MAG: MFS transporter [Chitinivibrionales bacterium]|nr:MFS transporter [Chitinivibrionales bacterium]MBD3394365.1 MFS transporter [Chitinivibrionales bacterium]